MPATEPAIKQVLLLEFLTKHPLEPRYTLKQPGDIDRMDRIWPMLSRSFVAHTLHDRDNGRTKE